MSMTEAAFEGFRVTRRHPGAVLLWAAVWLVGFVAMLIAAAPFIAPWMDEIATAQGGPETLSEGAQRAVQLAGYAFAPVALLIQAVLLPAVYRAVLRPEERRFGYLRLGRDEARILLVSIALAVVSLALNLAGGWLERQAAAAVGLPAGLLVALAVFVVTLIFSVRVSLIAPLTFARRQLSFVEGWRASGPRFWPLLGLTVIVLTMAIVVMILLVLIGWPLWILVGAPGGAAAGVGALLMLCLMAFGMALVSTITWAPFAVVAGELTRT